jgi:hypothetical protein
MIGSSSIADISMIRKVIPLEPQNLFAKIIHVSGRDSGAEIISITATTIRIAMNPAIHLAEDQNAWCYFTKKGEAIFYIPASISTKELCHNY